MQTEDHNNLNAISLSKAHVVKAVVFVSPPGKSNSLVHIYCGSYLDRSLILSRIKWKTRTTLVDFPAFSIRMRYNSILYSNCTLIASSVKWEAKFATTFDWSAIFSYLHDPIIHNRTKEFLYKIYTRAHMVGTRVETFKANTKSCVHCGLDEDELHAFINCNHSIQVWNWFHRLIAKIYSAFNIDSLKDYNYLFGFHTIFPMTIIKPWKVLHAELLRAIWWARNQLLFDNKSIDHREVIAIIKKRALESIHIYRLCNSNFQF